MSDKKNGLGTKILVAVAFVFMVTINTMAVTLPINGVGTGQVSDFYRNLFAPAGVTFSIWGLIYILLAGYTLYQFGLFRNEKSLLKEDALNKIGLYFVMSSVANGIWIFSWHYYIIPLSLLLIIVVLVLLILIVNEIKKIELSPRDKLFVKIPFSIYFGWITVATIANATVLLVSLGWNGFGIAEIIWTVVIIIVGFLIGAITTIVNKDMAYGFVIIWAYFGILLKHTSVSGFADQYPAVINTVMGCIILLIITEVYVLITNLKRTD
ncbi:MAG: tryptophan-rich sensory protein [Acetobacterium sp.]